MFIFNHSNSSAIVTHMTCLIVTLNDCNVKHTCIALYHLYSGTLFTLFTTPFDNSVFTSMPNAVAYLYMPNAVAYLYMTSAVAYLYMPNAIAYLYITKAQIKYFFEILHIRALWTILLISLSPHTMFMTLFNSVQHCLMQDCLTLNDSV